MRRTLLHRQVPLFKVLFVLSIGLLLGAPVERRTEGPRPALTQETSVLVARGMTLKQMVRLEEPVTEQISFRIWGRVEAGSGVRLAVRCTSAGKAQPLVEVPPPPADGAYHALDIPWCDLAGERDVGFMLEGEGVRLLASVADRFPGSFAVNTFVQAQGGLVVQLLQRTPGVDRYIPVSKLAAGKPGIIGWPNLYLLLPYLYIVFTGTLFRFVINRRTWLFT